MYTTLNRIYSARQGYKDIPDCQKLWEKLLAYLGKTSPDDNVITMSVLLDAVGLFGAIWCLRTIDGHEEDKKTFAEYCKEGHTYGEITGKFLELFGENYGNI